VDDVDATASDAGGQEGDGVDGGAHDGVGLQCIGPAPPSSAWGAQPGPTIVATDAGGDAGAANPTALGAPAPTCRLTDFQPQSCGFKATYSLEPFKGKVTVAALLAGW
jgi:hypothetical protein